MVFTSFNFFLFFPSVAVLYWITPIKYRWITLLITSYFFYLNVKPAFALLLIGVTLSTYLFTRLMDKTNIETNKKIYMVINIVLILLPLFFFKYFSNINAGVYRILESFHVKWPLPEIKLILPIGISFYTFMAVGYTIDVYNEDIQAEKNPGIVALFISFFPLILSGPIERAKNMLPQFNSQKKVDYIMMSHGLKLMIWGYFMKLVVANRLGIYIDEVYNNLELNNGTTLLFTSLLYPFQIYADLGGYSLIAIGTAKILGIHVMPNFNNPFFATSLSEFWRRWHISLISWLRDYLYTPLSFAFRKHKEWGIVLALMVTFMISGLWHGATLSFIAWGLMQGIFLSIEALSNRQKQLFENKYKLQKKTWYILFSCSVTYLMFSGSMIFVRAEKITLAIEIYEKIFTTYKDFKLTYAPLGFLILTLGAMFLLLIFDGIQQYRIQSYNKLIFNYRFIGYFLYASIVVMILLLGVFSGERFIYFQY